jgi:flagellum-specific ATP synthase
MAVLEQYFERVRNAEPLRSWGRVTTAVGQIIESEGPLCSLGDSCEIIDAEGQAWPAEAVGFRGPTVITMPLERPSGVRFGDRICSTGARPSILVGEALRGRVLDGAGNPIDNLGAVNAHKKWHIDVAAPLPLERAPIHEPLACGIRAIDGLLTCGRGQRIGIFGGSGVGKSSLIGMMARGTAADITVLGLVGERGREVRDFLEGSLGAEGRRKSVTVVSTSDQSPLLRIRAALTATAIAEYFAAQGLNVLLVVDSLTRFAMAQREIGLAAGEPPTTKAYTPSVFAMLARLVERAGNFERGSITAFYTVLMEGDDQMDPLVDAVRSLLDGHMVLDRKLASANHYPAINVLDSLSRLMPSICSPEHLVAAGRLRRWLAAHRNNEDLLRVGAYQKGSDAELDQAIRLMPQLGNFLQQRRDEPTTLQQTINSVLALGG